MGAKSTKKAKPAAKAAKVAAEPVETPMPKADLAKAFREMYTPPPAVSSSTVVLDPDVAPHFQSSRAVNDALRALLRIVRQVKSS